MPPFSNAVLVLENGVDRKERFSVGMVGTVEDGPVQTFLIIPHSNSRGLLYDRPYDAQIPTRTAEIEW